MTRMASLATLALCGFFESRLSVSVVRVLPVVVHASSSSSSSTMMMMRRPASGGGRSFVAFSSFSSSSSGGRVGATTTTTGGEGVVVVRPPLPSSSSTAAASWGGGGGGGGATLRRRRSIRPNPSTLASLAARMPGYREGAIFSSPSPPPSSSSATAGRGTTVLRSTTEDMTTSSTSSTSTSDKVIENENDDDDVRQLFPNIGKDVLSLPPRMRFAPSPTGSLHVGGARTALYNWLVARRGRSSYENNNNDVGDNNDAGRSAFVLRVEDTDVARSTKESEDSVIADLTWLGLNWDEGPETPSAKYGPYRQSERDAIYTRVASYLVSTGRAYPCFCTPEELEIMKLDMEAKGVPPRYDGTWRDADPSIVESKLASGVPHTIRFKVPPGARVVIDDAVRGTVTWDADATVGDFILLRSSGVPVYNFCVAVDDAAMGITTVIRAEEHLTNTLRQGLILDALGAPRPRYAHCSLILGEDRQKLSKRHGATSCNQFRLDGFLPDAMVNYLALLGWNDGTDNEIFTRDELIEAFDVDRIVKSPSVFDMDKLRWVNSQHLKRMGVEDMLHLVEEQLTSMDMIRTGGDGKEIRDFVFACTALAKQMMETTRDAATNAKAVLGYDLPSTFDGMPDGSEARTMVMRGNFHAIATRLLGMYDAGILPMPRPDDPLAAFVDATSGAAIVEDTQVGGDAGSYPQEYKSTMKSIAKEMDLKGKGLFHPVRLALTGEMSGQDVTKQLSLLAMAEGDGSVVNVESAGVVPFGARMERLRAFCETIPAEYRTSKEASSRKDATTTDAVVEKSDIQPATTSSSSSSSSAASTADPMDSYDGPPITALDIRVGRITRVWSHEESEKLFCEEIDVGEGEPRLIASGLRPYMSAEDLDGRLVLVLCNLKERKLAGFPSHGMVLCASNEDHTVVRLVSVPVEARVGERVTVPGVDFGMEGAAPFAENKIGKQKVFEKIAPFLRTGKYGVPEFCGRPLLTSAGVCTSPINNGSVS